MVGVTDGPAVVVVEERRLVREGVCSLLSRAGYAVSASYARIADLNDPPVGAILVLGQLPDLNGRGRTLGPKLRTVQLTDSFAELLGDLQSSSAEKVKGPSVAVAQSSSAQRLSPRELQILGLISQGMSAGEMAMALGVSRSTIEHHKQQMFVRVGVQSQAHAVAISRRTRSVNPTAG